ncbi:glycosyltransferase family 4 protein [Pontibacter qinzhouensis]|uniref:Glycosyltransferase family 4 protein n=1 Tax=Pontibacter qinzhouensis TaxID=2603253 RepID=A0A5C8KB07_9BACT|nr:glycosyltransferase family 4 protein [Pontibacter qinzhouensis]TXK47110.1 glycosyltransferase family 4 protein [Pontibacter qinzhouensis]
MANILIVVPVIAHEGITSLVTSQVDELLLKNLNITVVVLSSIKLDYSPFNLPPDKVIELHSSETYLSVKALFNSVKIIKSLVSIVTSKKIEVVFAHAPYGHFNMRVVKCLLKSKNTFRLVQYFHFPQFEQFPNNTLRRKLFHLVFAQLAKISDDVHVSVSQAVKADIENNFIKIKNHKVIYNPMSSVPENIINKYVDSSIKFSNNKFKILLPGRLDHNKGQLFFITVFSQFVKQNKLTQNDVTLIIIGDGDILNNIKDTIVSVGLQSYIELRRGVERRFLLKLMSISNMVVVPSYLEGLGMVVLEALQTKTLVLASDTRGINEIISHKETGYLFRPGDIEDCLEKLNYIFNHRYTTLINQDKVKNVLNNTFSLEKHVEQLMELIEPQSQV